MPVGQKKFLEYALFVNQQEGRPFSCLDFPYLTRTNYRKYIQKSKKYLELVSNSHPKFWKIKDIKLAGDSHRITLMGMGDGEKFFSLLESLRIQQPAIHDIKVMFHSDLHKNMMEKGYSLDKSNYSIKVNFPSSDNNLNIKIHVYPQTIQIDIGCTFKPLIYDPNGVYYLHEILSKISYHLEGLSGCLSIPRVSEWVITHYHFGKDIAEISGYAFHMTFGEVGHGLLRFYNKKMPNGSSITRLEEIRTPQRTMADELRSILE